MPSAKPISALSHPFRQKMLWVLSNGGITYSDLLSSLEPKGSERGRFNYHLRALREAGLVRVVEGLYVLTSSGKAALRFLKELSENPHQPNRRRRPLAIVWSLLAVGLLGATALLAVVFTSVPTGGPTLTTESGWGSPTLMVTGLWGEWAGQYGVVMDSSGNGLVVWQQEDSSQSSIHGSWFVPEVGWSTATLIRAGSSRWPLDWPGYYPRVASASEGSAMVLWIEEGTRLMSSQHILGVGWGAPLLVHEGEVRADLAMGASGDAFAVWKGCMGEECGILAKRFVSGTGWSHQERIDLEGVGRYGVDPRVALDQEGNALVVWARQRGRGDDAVSSPWANRYSVGTGWGTPIAIGGEARSVGSLDLAVDPSGRAVAVWVERDGDGVSLYTRQFTPVFGWGVPTVITSFVGGRAKVSTDAWGHAMVTWEEREFKGEDDSDRYDPWNYTMSLMASRFVPGVGWDEANLIERFDMYDPAWRPYCYASGGDRDGNAMVIWQDQGNPVTLDPPAIYASRFVPGLGWSGKELVGPESDPRFFPGCPDITFDPEGNALAGWRQTESAGDAIYVNRFVSSSPSEDVLQAVRDALDFANLRLATFEGRLLFLAGLGMALVILTSVLFVLYWNLRRGLANHGENPDNCARPPGSGGE